MTNAFHELVAAHQAMLASFAIPSALGTPDPGMSGSGFALSQMAQSWGYNNHPVQRDTVLERFRRVLLDACVGRSCELSTIQRAAMSAVQIDHRARTGRVDHLLLQDHLLARGNNALEAAFRKCEKWLVGVHDAADHGCQLCGDPIDEQGAFYERIDLDVPAPPLIRELNGKVYRLESEHLMSMKVTACSRACATAYAIKCSPLRERPAVALALEARHQEREMAAAKRLEAERVDYRPEVTDSEPVMRFELLTLETTAVDRHDIWTHDP